MEIYHQIVENIRGLLARILEPRLDLDAFLAWVARMARDLDPEHLETRVYEVDFIENFLYLKTSTQLDVCALSEGDRTFRILPKTVTGDATIENRPVVGTAEEGYGLGRFGPGGETRAAFPIEFHDVDLPEGRTKYVLVVDRKNGGCLEPQVVSALNDYAVLAGLAISIKELRDKLSRFYEENRNLVLTGQHSAAIGHDIRSLNVGVGGYVGLALKLLAGDDADARRAKARDLLSMAQENARQIEVLLGNFAQFNRQRMILNRDTDLVNAVARKIESLRHRADMGRWLDLELSLPETPSGILVDADWFSTVVENLVKNSVDACGGLTRMYVTLKVDPDRVQLIFEDDCGGIPSDIIRDIFTPFRSGKKKGHGLGLANARKVVEDHGGTIFVTSRAGHGAVFTIEFGKNA
jgi:signal transduction histidine kinase